MDLGDDGGSVYDGHDGMGGGGGGGGDDVLYVEIV